METIPYRNKYFRVLAALGATLFILFRGHPFDLYYALGKPMFWYAFLVSFPVALLFVYLVHYITLRLDTLFPWKGEFPLRFLSQIGLGIVAPVAVDLLIFAGYFWTVDQDIMTNGFLTIDLWRVFTLLSLLNFYYALHAYYYYWRKSKRKDAGAGEEKQEALLNEKAQEPEEPEPVVRDSLQIEYNGITVHLSPEDIYCCYRSDKKVRILTADKNNYPSQLSINALETLFRERGFYRTSRGVLINGTVVLGYKTGLERNTLRLLLKQKYSWVMQVLTYDQLVVTRDHLDAIKNAFACYKQN